MRYVTFADLKKATDAMTAKQLTAPVRLCTLAPAGDPIQTEDKFVIKELVEKPHKVFGPVIVLKKENW